MKILRLEYTVKPESIGEPNTYLGTGINKVLNHDGSYA